VSIKF